MNLLAYSTFSVRVRRGGVLSRREKQADGFSLVELLVVIAILAILASIAIVSISGIKGSRDLAKATADVQGVLEQARTMAMAGDTYTWVGFFEEDPTAAATAPRAPGNGQVVIALVSSKDGSNLSTQLTAAGKLPPTVLNQVMKLVKIPNLHVDYALSAGATAARPAATYEVNPTLASGTGTIPPTFDFPINPAAGAVAAYNFKQIIQFNSRGDASVIYGPPTQFIEIGLRPTHGNVVATASTDVAAIQVTGIGGQVITYRP